MRQAHACVSVKPYIYKIVASYHLNTILDFFIDRRRCRIVGEDPDRLATGPGARYSVWQHAVLASSSKRIC